MVDYVEWDSELEEEQEEDIEDFGGFPSKESHLEGDDHGKNSSSFFFCSYPFHY